MIAPLAFVIGLSMAKEAMEDWRRFIQDMKVNMRKARVHKGDGVFGPKPWMKLRVGDVVKVEKDKFFPADLLLVSSSYEDGICYVETMNLDGETNLKVKRALRQVPNATMVVYATEYAIEAKILYDPNNAFKSSFFHCVTALILYGYLIPISLYVSIEVVKVLQAMFINKDIHMYDEESGTPAQARTSNLNEELGQVDTILSDKTGTLTCNQMDFLKCSIAGMAYGTRSSEVELAAAMQMALNVDGQVSESTLKVPPHAWKLVKEPNADVILLFFRILAICHTAIPEANEETGGFNYEAESPDEGAFLVAAREFGFEFVKELNPAYSIIFERLSKNGRMYEEATTKHLKDYGEGGLRTLALAYRKLEEAEYSAWNNEFIKAKTSIGGDREAMLERVSDLMERDLILIGATAVEDKLQKGVPQCIDKLAQAGLKIWVLTGDKLETAINIGSSASTGHEADLHNKPEYRHAAQDSRKAVKDDIVMQITNASQMIKLEKDPHAAFALIIDGKTLSYALEDDLKHEFLNLAVVCASVICDKIGKTRNWKITLAIGDGANDVGMIQEADIGVGISGVEGMQSFNVAGAFERALFYEGKR
ncbi:hypothetical protein C3L33_00154, partial [Rhododendron williamsianum]